MKSADSSRGTLEYQLAAISQQYHQVRSFSQYLADPLSPEDQCIQSMPDVSPTKWHLAHTTWFFEEFILAKYHPDYQVYHPEFSYLFNSYYNAIGERHPRPQRGLLSRPGVGEIQAYRDYVDEILETWLDTEPMDVLPEIYPLLEIGIHHEQQHQELLLTDIKHVLSCNPLYPAYREQDLTTNDSDAAPPMTWVDFDGGTHEIGHQGDGFAYDNESPRHRVLIDSFQLASRLVTNGEYLAFIEAGGYEQPQWWLSDGWATVQAEGWQAPDYWHFRDGQWYEFTLLGLRRLNLAGPVCHVSFYEAEAFARWSQARLPTEQEWEIACDSQEMRGNFVEQHTFHPQACSSDSQALHQCFGDVWEWTASPYICYPGYQPADGAIGEYNGKFMCNQMTLRGGSCATSQSHIRPTYRNFFPPPARWQFTGIRLAQHLEGNSS